MKSLNNKISKWLFPAFVIGLLGVISCESDEEEQMELSRMFMPAGEIGASSGETSVELYWKASLNTEAATTTYTVEVAKDTLFQTPVILTGQTDTAAITFTDAQLPIKEYFFARVKTNAKGNSPESKWLVSSRFRIRGEQIFSPVVNTEIKDKTAILRWRESPGLTKIVVTPAGGTPTEVMLTPEQVAAREIKLTSLTASTAYTAEIFAGSVSKGVTSFTTTEPSIFTYTLAAGSDLVAAAASAAPGDVIGLEPGVYDASTSNILIAGKYITLRSVSGNPRDTKVHFKEITLKGAGAGIRINGIEFDGKNKLGEATGDYFINIDATPGTLSSITVENCIVHDLKSTFMRGNRVVEAGTQKIDFIKIDQCIVSKNVISNYQTFMLDKLELNRLDVTNSTFNEAGRGFISYATAFTPSNRPTFFVDRVTLNNFGSGGRDNIIFDATASIVVNFTMQNSIVANAPKPGQTVGPNAIRAGVGSNLEFKSNNYFKIESGSPLAPLIFSSVVTQSNNKTIDLGWTAATTDFTLPTGSELRTAGIGGTAIGDPRWAL
ncbi:DUF4957 domain-containing protein [Rufibacter immobilis]|uniref:DUF4957 domain-containing protein n=1 Tax=Rufibacter immobilis TaxID=1348778 RepID=A0A3M9MSV8_9BACT|nr:DUF4957 domain-containing protein [Rufibacter immobilis]RNI28285.1 DUF4957 domain-containing protein [Rufibacter immobilis]